MKKGFYIAILMVYIPFVGRSQQWLAPGEGPFLSVTSLAVGHEDIIGAQLTDLRLGAMVGYRLQSKWDFGWQFYWQSEDAYKKVFPDRVLTRDQWINLDHRRIITGPRLNYTDSLSFLGIPLAFTAGVSLYRGWQMAGNPEAGNGNFNLAGGELSGILIYRLGTGNRRFFFTPGIGPFLALNDLTDTSRFGLEDMREVMVMQDGLYGGADIMLPFHLRIGESYPVQLSLLLSIRYVAFSHEGNSLSGRIVGFNVNF
ncbi:hypothetical protein AB9P05_13875 [Roseivirga sp. BDSF3-8]|uniref:hypothetical protein n=1 Tax=Roseivirga sp. BDSF3-8 TaxID=3241598 RepID=UPI003531A155